MGARAQDGAGLEASGSAVIVRAYEWASSLAKT